MDLLTERLITPVNIDEIAGEIRQVLEQGPALTRAESWKGGIEFHHDLQLIKVEATPSDQRNHFTNSAHLTLLFTNVAFHFETAEDPVIIWTHPGSFTIEMHRRPNDDSPMQMITFTVPPIVEEK